MNQEVEDSSPEGLKNETSNPNYTSEGGNSDDDSIIDVSGKSLEFSMLEEPNPLVRDLYLYKNEFNLLPRWVGQLQKLKTLKFFANEVNLFPSEFGNLTGLEKLQVKISPPELNGLALHKLKGLKELDLSKALRRPSVFPMLSEIAQLNCLTKLSVCHFSIRCLPPEIGCLKSLEYLDLSFNKMKSLPNEITYLNSLISLKVSNNKLVELPLGLSSLQQLENLDLSNNRLTSLGSLELSPMRNLRSLNLQYNKLLNYQMPSWICCYLEGNGGGLCIDDCNSSVEMDVYESTIQGDDRSLSYNGSYHTKPNLQSGSSSNSRCFSARKSSKRWKRRHYLQQRARQERLNNSRKWKGEKYNEEFSRKATEICKLCDADILAPDAIEDGVSEIECLEDAGLKALVSVEAGTDNLPKPKSTLGEMINLKADVLVESCSHHDNSGSECVNDYCQDVSAVRSSSVKKDKDLLLHKLENTASSKRHCDKTLENPKPCKYRKASDESSNLSRKYSNVSFCGVEDYLQDGFYDAGRDRPFMPLSSYEQNFPLDSREVILLDRGRDEVLDAIALSAQALVVHFKLLNSKVRDEGLGDLDNLQVASLLSLFVSDHFGGCDRSSIIEQTRKVMSGSNYRKPFICTCSTGKSDSTAASSKKSFNDEDIVLADICERSLNSIKARQNSIVVPIGSLKFGICRHRALLLKYLCDRMEPPVPCELVRGYLDFSPHAWNIVLAKKGDTWVRMVVDACRPHDIREETDREYFCRYIPLSRMKIPLSTEIAASPNTSFPSLSACDEIEKANSTSLVRCTYGSADVVAKVRTLEVCGSSIDEFRNFEYNCLGEVRILGAVEHACIVKMFGHRISSKWVPAVDGNPQRRILHYAIYMEYIKGGSLKSHMEKLSRSGDKHVPVDLALSIAKDVASALAELHLKHIIHRDIKSENILIDLDASKADGAPVVKLCDFDRAVPLRSSLHTCCIAHSGIPPPNMCVGTPRWMAPEVLQAMHERTPYGLEVDIWSYGCLLLELLTLQVPYAGLADSAVHDLILAGRRPKLTEDIEELVSLGDNANSGSCTDLEGIPDRTSQSLRFLVDLYRQCTEKDPADRPLARDIYESLLSHMKDSTSVCESKQD